MYDLNLRRSSSFWYERSLRTASYASIAILVLLSVAIISPVYIQSKLAEAAPGAPTASTLSFTGTNLVASATLTVNSPTGTFATSGENEKSSFSISTNNYTGYTLTLRSSGANTNLSDGGSHSISALPASTTQAVFSSNDVTGQVLNNKWGYIPSYYNSVANTTTYYPAPTNVNTATLRATSSANSADGTSNADDYTIGLGFRADYNSPSGTYSNDTFILEYVANPVTYLISFDDNTGDSSVYGIPSVAVSGSASSTSITLPSTVPTRTGYTFNAWCLGVVSNSGTTCVGLQFEAGSDFGIDQTMSNTVTLYALWAPDTYSLIVTGDANISSLSLKKGSTSGDSISCSKASDIYTCTDLEYGVSYYLYPMFDNNYGFDSWSKTDNTTGASLSSTSTENAFYTIGLGDGALTITSKVICNPSGTSISTIVCMQDVTTSNKSTILASMSLDQQYQLIDNRDKKSYYIAKLADGNIWMTQNLDHDIVTIQNFYTPANTDIPANWTASNATYQTDDFSWSGGHDAPDSYNPGDYCWSGTIEDDTYEPCNQNGGHYHLGNYYDWTAAVAMNNSSSYAINGTDVNQSICPAGWTLPKSGNSADLLTRYGLNTVSRKMEGANESWDSPLFINLSSYWIGMPGMIGEYGGFWSPVASSNQESYALVTGFDRSVVTDYATASYIGFSVRCLARVEPQSLTINFAGSGVSSVKVCTTTGNCSGSELKGTVTSSGGSVSGLSYGTQYYLYPTFTSGYTIDSWVKTSNSGMLSSTNLANPSFTIGAENGAVTLTGRVATYNLAISFAGSGVSSVQVRTASGTGGTLMGTVAASGGSVSGLVYNTAYYLYPIFAPGYVFSSWAKTSSTGTLSSTFSSNPTFTMGAGNGAVTITGSCPENYTISNIGTMQRFGATCNKSSVLNSMTVGTAYTLTDTRDNKTYNIAKLADGNAWMLDNLALDLTDSSVKSAMYDSSDTKTNASYSTLGYLFNGGGLNSDQYATSKVNDVAWTSASQNFYSIPMIVTDYINTKVRGYGPVAVNGKSNVGIYYNYCAASAGSYCWGDGTSSTGSPTSDPDPSSLLDIKEDICPYGWHIPTGKTNGEYNSLYNSYSDLTSFVNALSTPLSGAFWDGSAHLQDTYFYSDILGTGYFWASTFYDDDAMHHLEVNTSQGYAHASATAVVYRTHGNSVRCMLK